MICPPVSSCAMPRPATMRMSVATMGCMPAFTTSRPFHNPQAVATANALASASHSGCSLTTSPSALKLPPTIDAATTAAMAMTAPTEMSSPRTAMTSVMPSDTTMSGAARFRMSIRFPNRWPSCQEIARNPGWKIADTRMSSASVNAGQNSAWRASRFTCHPRSWRTPHPRRRRAAARPPWRGRASPRCDPRRAPLPRSPPR